MTIDWHAAITTTDQLTEAAAEAVMEALAERGPAITLDTDSATVSLTAHGDTAQAALADALTAITSAGLDGDPVSVTVQTYEALDRELAQPLFPEVVGYAEIAEIAGVTRQRARQFAEYDSFPAPVIQTAQGPLYSRAAAARWVETRPTRPGRPARA